MLTRLLCLSPQVSLSSRVACIGANFLCFPSYLTRLLCPPPPSTPQVSLSSRVACIGANGAGKSTLIKVLTGETEATAGMVWKHPNLRIAYVAQHAFHHLEQHLDKTPNEYIQVRSNPGGWTHSGEGAVCAHVSCISAGLLPSVSCCAFVGLTLPLEQHYCVALGLLQ
jgi:hypothetical protein